MRDMENVEPALLQQNFDYHEKGEMEAREEARDAMKEYRIDKCDPSRPVIKWEKSVQTKRKNEIVRQIRMINIGKEINNI